MVESFDKITLSGRAGNGRIQRRIQDHFGLLECIQLTRVPQELQEAQVPRQSGFADASKHVQVRLEQRKQTLRPMLMHVTPRVCLLRMIDKLVYIALQGSRAVGRVRVELTPFLHRDVGSLLHCPDGTVPCRLHHDTALATDPGDNVR